MDKDLKVDSELLKRLLPPPKTPASAPTEAELNAIEHSLEIKLPADYRLVSMTYGAGWIDDFIRLNSIKKEKGGATLSEQLKNCRSELSDFESEDSPVRLCLWPTPKCVIPWGRSANGDWLLMDQASETVFVVDSKGDEVESFSMGIVLFLVKYLQEDIDIGIFPEDAVLDRPTHVFAVDFGTTLQD